MKETVLPAASILYRALFDAGNEAMLVLDPHDSAIVDANTKFSEQFGYVREEWEYLLLSDIICNDNPDIANTLSTELRSLRHACNVQCRAQSKSRHFFRVELQLKPLQIEQQTYILGTIHDISELNQNESRLQESAKHWRSITENVPDFIIVVDRQGTIQFINKALPCHDRNDVLGKSTFDFQPPQYRDSMRRCMDQVFATGNVATLETRVTDSSGEVRYFFNRLSPIKENNEIVSVLLIATDITDAKKTEQALRTSTTSLRKAHEIANIGDWSWDLKTNEVTWSDTLYQIYGYDKAVFEGNVWDIIFQTIHPEDKASLDNTLHKISNKHASQWRMDYRIIRPDGELRYLWGDGEYLCDENGDLRKVIGVVQDVTERQLNQQALQRSKAELKQRNLSLTTINNIADRVFRALDVSSVAREAVHAIAEFANAPSISFYLLDRQSASVELAYATEPHQATKREQCLPVNDALFDSLITEKNIVCIEDIHSSKRLGTHAKNTALQQGYVSAVYLPAVFNNEVTGIIHFAYSDRHKLTELEADTLSSLGKSIGLALGNARQIAQLEIEMRERKHAEETLRNIALGVSAATGDEFFRSLVTNVANTFDVDYAFLGELDKSTKSKITTLAVFTKGSMAGNFEYDLKDTPCENVMNNHPCAITESVQQKFPRDLLLQDMGVESYVGTPLYNSDGTVSGIFVTLHSKPLSNPQLVLSMLQIFAVRAAAELERLYASQALQRSEEHLRLALNASNVGTWEWDITSGKVTWSQNAENIFYLPRGYFKGSYTEYFELIHPDDIALVETAINDAINGVRPYAVEYRIKCQREQDCWIYCQAEVHRDSEGKPIRMLGTVSDVSERKNTELKVKASQKMLQLVLDSIPVRVFWKDLNSAYLGCNKLFAQDAGIGSAQQIIGKTDHDMVWQDQAEHYRCDDQQVIQSGLPKLQYEELQTQSDKSVWLETSKIPLTDLKGNIIGVLGTYTDISERKKAIEDKRLSEQRLMLHFQQTPLAVIEWNTDMAIVEWNQAAESIFGYSHDEAVGRSLLNLIVPKEKQSQLSNVAVSLLHSQSGKRNINENITKDGRMIICDWYNTPLVDENGQVIGVASAAMDITERVKTEQELEQYREHLEELVEQRTDELTRVNKELEAFSYSVSHDLRAPLRSIEGFSQILMEDYYDKLDEEGKDHLQRVRQGAQRMAQLIDDILKLSRLTRSQLKHENVNVSEIANEIATSLQKESPERSAQFKIAPDLFAYGDEGLLIVVLDNLINNAWKYTSKKPHTVIEVGGRTDGKETIHWIKDNGAGFNMKYVDKLFGAFQRLHQIHEFDGSGIGLATVARIIHRHGGNVWAEGVENKGAQFYFSLPKSHNR